MHTKGRNWKLYLGFAHIQKEKTHRYIVCFHCGLSGDRNNHCLAADKHAG